MRLRDFRTQWTLGGSLEFAHQFPPKLQHQWSNAVKIWLNLSSCESIVNTTPEFVDVTNLGLGLVTSLIAAHKAPIFPSSQHMS
jgi:hypothetical protein